MENGNIMLVTIQYRLNTLGFLSTGDSASPGNYAFKDQIMALQWIRENIGAFGGNPDAITISGQSAGSGSSHLLMLSPLSQGLFKAAIPFSGSGLAHWNIPTPDPLALARNHSRLLNITNADQLSPVELIEELRRVPADEIIRTVPLMKWMGADPPTLYRVVIEQNETGDAFLSESPYDALRNGRVARVPALFSVVANEGAFRTITLVNDPRQREALNSDPEGVVSIVSELPASAPQNFSRQIVERYNLTEGVTVPFNESAIHQMSSDRSFFHPAYRTLQFHLNVSDAPLFFQNFTYRGQYSFSTEDPTRPTEDYGVIHTDDLIYLFESPGPFPGGLNREDSLAKDMFVEHIIQFVMNQTVPMGPSAQCQEMNPMCNYLRFFKNATGLLDVEVRNDFDMEMVRFWDQTNEIPFN